MKARDMKDFRRGQAGQLQSTPMHGSDDDCSATAGSAGAYGGSTDNTPDYTQASGFDAIVHETQELWENKGQLEKCFENLKSYHQQDYAIIMEAIQEERYRSERLKEQLDDLTELHQNEILNLKEELAGIEENAYPYYEGATDIHEALQACQTRLFKLEQQQQLVQLEGSENTTQTVLAKLINVLLAVIVVTLVFVSTMANWVIPLVKTGSRALTTLVCVVLCSILWRHWDAVSEYPKYLICAQHAEKGDNEKS